MNGMIGFLGCCLCAGALCTGAAAQQPLAQGQPSYGIVSAPVVIASGQVIGTQTSVPSNAQTRTVEIATAAAQPAPYRPAPLGTYIETSADQRTVIAQSGYTTTTDINGRPDTSVAMLTDGLGGAGQVFPADAPAQLWPLQVGKSVTFSYAAYGPLTVTASVLRTETITVPAGTFYTYVIERRLHPNSEFRQDIATYWYAPSVGSVVKFAEKKPVGTSRRPYEMVSIVLPHPLEGSFAVTTPGDTADRRAQFCEQNGTSIALADGRSKAVPCMTYVAAHLPAYTAWLNSSQTTGMPR